MAAIFGLQVLLDINRELGKGVSRAIYEMLCTAHHLTNSLDGVIELHDDRPASQVAGMVWVLDSVKKWTNQDYIKQSRTKSLRATYWEDILQKIVDECIDTPDFYLLKRNPGWCGLLTYRFQMMGQEASLTLANSSGSVLPAAHLYNLLRQEAQLTCNWPDLDQALLLHHNDGLLVGGYPKTFTAYRKNHGRKDRVTTKRKGTGAEIWLNKEVECGITKAKCMMSIARTTCYWILNVSPNLVTQRPGSLQVNS